MIAAIDARKSTEQNGVADEPWILADAQHAPVLVSFRCPKCDEEIRLDE